MVGVDLSKDEQRTTYGGLILFFPSVRLALSEMFSATVKYIDTPARHCHINAHKKRAIVTIIVAKTIAKIASKRMAGLIAKPCLSSAVSVALSSLATHRSDDLAHRIWRTQAAPCCRT
jgi:hypothetical protein